MEEEEQYDEDDDWGHEGWGNEEAEEEDQYDEAVEEENTRCWGLAMWSSRVIDHVVVIDDFVCCDW